MILVVEDHDDSRYALVRLLQRFGHDVAEADGGQQAIDFLRDFKPSLILLDCNMPCVDGLDVLRSVRGEERLANVPVVMFTADTHSERRAEFDRLGVQGWIKKASMDWDQLAQAAKRFGG